MHKLSSLSLFKNIKTLIQASRVEVVHSINTRMIEIYFQIGRSIVEFEQQGKPRAGYAANTLKSLSKNLIKEFGKGFSVDSLESMRKFYLVYGKSETVSRKSSQLKNFQKSGNSVSEIFFYPKL